MLSALRFCSVGEQPLSARAPAHTSQSVRPPPHRTPLPNAGLPVARNPQALSLYGRLVSDYPDLALAEYGRIGRALMLYQVRHGRTGRAAPAGLACTAQPKHNSAPLRASGSCPQDRWFDVRVGASGLGPPGTLLPRGVAPVWRSPSQAHHPAYHCSRVHVSCPACGAP